jgi:hypothetical protein
VNGFLALTPACLSLSVCCWRSLVNFLILPKLPPSSFLPSFAITQANTRARLMQPRARRQHRRLLCSSQQQPGQSQGSRPEKENEPNTKKNRRKNRCVKFPPPPPPRLIKAETHLNDTLPRVFAPAAAAATLFLFSELFFVELFPIFPFSLPMLTERTKEQCLPLLFLFLALSQLIVRVFGNRAVAGRSVS